MYWVWKNGVTPKDPLSIPLHPEPISQVALTVPMIEVCSRLIGFWSWAQSRSALSYTFGLIAWMTQARTSVEPSLGMKISRVLKPTVDFLLIL